MITDQVAPIEKGVPEITIQMIPSLINESDSSTGKQKPEKEMQKKGFRISGGYSLINTIKNLAIGAFLFLVMNSWAAHAKDIKPDTDFVPKEVVSDVTSVPEELKEHDWDFYLRTGLSGSFAGSSNVIGAVDGNTWTFGGSLHHGAYYASRGHESRNDTRLQGAFARTPLVDDWVKSGDELDFQSMYFYRLPELRWIGPFGRARLKTQFFPGADVRPDTVTYVISKADGTTSSLTAKRMHLTDAFSPLTLRQTAGAFLKPETPAFFRVEALVGFGARQTFADGQYVISNDKDLTAIAVTELKNFNQAGSELMLGISGELDEGRFGYSASAELMTPFINDILPDDDRTAIELTNIELKLSLSLRPYSWLSIDYQFRALREPQMLDSFQVTNSLLFGISYTLIERGVSK